MIDHNIESSLLEKIQQILDFKLASEIYSETEMASLNFIFNEIELLVKTVTIDSSKRLLKNPLIIPLLSQLRAIRAQYEFQQEKIQALNLLNSQVKGTKLAETIINPYKFSAIYNIDLVSRITMGAYNTCLIVGSGPLPTTALLFLSHFNLEVSCLDVSQESCQISEKIFQAINCESIGLHILSDILNYTNFSNFDIIFVNGLVGLDLNVDSNTTKATVVDHIWANKGQDTLLMLRSGYGLSQLFYPEIQYAQNTKLRTTSYPPSRLGRSSIVCIEEF